MLKKPIPIILVPISFHIDLRHVASILNKILNENSLNSDIFTSVSKGSREGDASLSLSTAAAESLLAENKLNELLDSIVMNYRGFNEQASDSIHIIEGVHLNECQLYAQEFNFEIARALDAVVVLVGAFQQNDGSKLNKNIQISLSRCRDVFGRDVLGFISTDLESDPCKNTCDFSRDKLRIFSLGDLNLLATLPKCENERSESKAFVDVPRFKRLIEKPYNQKLTPSVFKAELISLARSANKKIVLPEGDEPRTLKAASICAEQNIAECILLGDKEKINAVAKEHSIKLNERITIINPKMVYEKYIENLVELRRHKGMTPDDAKKQLQDNVMLGTMMLKMGDVDGLVSGAVNTTANTIRPALQIIKLKPGMSLVSSVFFMCFPTEVMVFGDCAINPNPTASELAEIAIQSADSASCFGISPRVAMLSYSTGKSGAGQDVEKVLEACNIVNSKRPDIMIDGPLQYDAASTLDVAKLKAPNSKVAGNATVFIFPDLNSGNISYKSVQRSTGIICMGPILQGLNKPVNDLSRGCFVEDIVFTIALTAVQAMKG